jgi:hypothetical protein
VISGVTITFGRPWSGLLHHLATVSRRGDLGDIQGGPATIVTIVASDDPGVCHLRAVGRTMRQR